MNAEELLSSIKTSFGAEATVRPRRPSLYQLSLPVFMADGDEAQVFVRLQGDGRAEVTDLGQTIMTGSTPSTPASKDPMRPCSSR
jgi:hypothetical protein